LSSSDGGRVALRPARILLVVALVLATAMGIAGYLMGSAGDPHSATAVVLTGVSTDRHRAELTVIDWDTGGGHPMHVAVRVHCLD
jgi:hypothetical protein